MFLNPEMFRRRALFACNSWDTHTGQSLPCPCQKTVINEWETKRGRLEERGKKSVFLSLFRRRRLRQTSVEFCLFLHLLPQLTLTQNGTGPGWNFYTQGEWGHPTLIRLTPFHERNEASCPKRRFDLKACTDHEQLCFFGTVRTLFKLQIRCM